MKKICYITMVVLLSLLCTACSSQVNVVGSWTVPITELGETETAAVTVQQYWIFNEDGSGSKVTKGLSDGGELTLDFTYKIEENEICITFAEELEPEQTFALSGNKKTLVLTQGSRIIELTKAE